MVITDITHHTAVSVGTTAVRVAPLADTDLTSSSKIDRNTVFVYVPSTFGGIVYLAIMREQASDLTGLDATIKAAVIKEMTAGTEEVAIGEGLDIFAWTDSGTVSVTAHSVVAREVNP